MPIDTEKTVSDYRQRIEGYNVTQLQEEMDQTITSIGNFVEKRKAFRTQQLIEISKTEFDQLFDEGIEILITGNVLAERIGGLSVQEQKAIESYSLTEGILNDWDSSLVDHLSILVERYGKYVVTAEQIAQLYTEISKTSVKTDTFREALGRKWVKIIFEMVEDKLDYSSDQWMIARRQLIEDGRFEELVKCVEHYKYESLPTAYYTDILYAQEPGTNKNALHIQSLCTRIAEGDVQIFDRMIAGAARHFCNPENIEGYFEYLTPRYIDQPSSNFVTSFWAHLIASTRVGKITLFQQTDQLINDSQPHQILERASRLTHILSGLLLGTMYGHQEGVASTLTATDLQEVKAKYIQVLQRIVTLSNNGYTPQEIKDPSFSYESVIKTNTMALIQQDVFTPEELEDVVNTVMLTLDSI